MSKNLLTGLVYISDGVEYCDWLSLSELSKEIFNISEIEIIKIIQNNKIITSTELLNQLSND